MVDTMDDEALDERLTPRDQGAEPSISSFGGSVDEPLCISFYIFIGQVVLSTLKLGNSINGHHVVMLDNGG